MELETWLEQRIDGICEESNCAEYEAVKMLNPDCYQQPQKLHVIGACEECKWWAKEGNDGWGKCGGNSEGGIFNDAEVNVTGHTFGCIHWDKKE